MASKIQSVYKGFNCTVVWQSRQVPVTLKHFSVDSIGEKSIEEHKSQGRFWYSVMIFFIPGRLTNDNLCL